MMNSTLILNANGAPLTYLPLSSVSWQEAIRFLWLDIAEVLHFYEDWEVHSPSVTLKVPAVMMLKHMIKSSRMTAFGMTPQKNLVFLRDMYRCQYCNKVFNRQLLTIDHVLPRRYGGTTRWDNITTACSACNGRRGSDIAIQPITRPMKPTHGQLLANLRQFPLIVPHSTWNDYLMWPSDKVIQRR